MQSLEVSAAVRPIYGSLGVKRLIIRFGLLLSGCAILCYMLEVQIWFFRKWDMEGMESIDPAQDRYSQLDLLNAVMNLLVS